MNDGTRFSANEALRRIFVLKDRVTGVWRKLHNEELNSVYSSPNIIRVIKIKKNLYRNCVTRGREERSKQGLGVGGGDLREKDQVDYLSVDGNITLKMDTHDLNVIHVRALISNQTTK